VAQKEFRPEKKTAQDMVVGMEKALFLQTGKA